MPDSDLGARGAPVPGELAPHEGTFSGPDGTPRAPSIASTTPGVALAGARVPGAPTVPDADPALLTHLVAALANDLFALPPEAAPGAAPATPATPSWTGASASSQPSAPAAMPPLPATASPAPSGAAMPTAPAGGAPAAVPVSPFSVPLQLDTLPGWPSLDLSVPLLDGPVARDQPPVLEAPSLSSPAFAYEIEPDVGLPQPDAGAPLDPNLVRSEFPILNETVHGRRLVWLDNAATTQKPRTVIDRVSYFYEHENSNVHRAAHTLAARATDAYEAARESVKRFVHARSVRDVVFVRGASEGINLVAKSWGQRNVGEGDEVVITWLEHHANIVPWQQLVTEKGARLRVAPVDDRGAVLLDEYEKLLGPRTRLVAFTQVSNALGTVTPAREMIAMAHRHGARVLLDGAQSVSHMPVDVQALDCDFFVFSGHKVFAPTGIGAVVARSEILDVTPPWQGGGNMIQDVTFERTVYQPAPARFEAGTGNIADAAGLGAALDWLTRVGVERVEQYEHGLLEYATTELLRVPGLKMIGTAPEKAGVLSFILAGQETETVGGLLDREGIAVRSGHHCAQPILRRFGVEATVRASLAVYNTKDDVDALVAALRRIQAGHVALA